MKRLLILLIVNVFPFNLNPSCLKTKELNLLALLNLGGLLHSFLKNLLYDLIQRWKNPVGDRIPIGFLFDRSLIMITFVRGRSFVHRKGGRE